MSDRINFAKDFLDYLKENLPSQLTNLNLELISDYIDYQPYYIPEFPENTPLITCYHIKSIPKLVEWEHHYGLDLYYYFEKQNLEKISEIMEKYANLLKDLTLDYCWKPDIIDINFNTYYAETDYYLVSISIRFKIYG